MKLLINFFLSSNPFKYLIPQSAFNFPARFIHISDICTSKFNLLSKLRLFEDHFFGSHCQLLLPETFLGYY